MKSFLRYENVYFRNIFSLFLLYTILYADYYFAPPNAAKEKVNFVQETLGVVFIYLLVFLNNYFLIRSYLLHKKLNIFLKYEIIYFFFTSFLFYHVLNYIDESSFISAAISVFIFLVVGIGFYFFHIWFLDNVIQTKKQLSQRDLELTFLKQQLNPHFLLNAMNNLYGISLSNPTMISDKILELSDLLRYQIEAVKSDEIAIENEIEFAQKYLNYMAFKSSNLKIQNKILGTIKPFMVPPLLFLPLIENASKFALQTTNPFINLCWNFEDDFVSFLIENNFSLDTNGKGTQIGISNLKRRLEILENQTELTIQSDKAFKVTLKLWPKNIDV